MSATDKRGAARAITRAVRDLPIAEIPKGVTFSRITDSAIRAASDARLGGTDQRVLEVLLRTVKIDAAGRLYVSQPSEHIAFVLGVRESSVRRSLARLCNMERCHGHPLLEVVVHGQPGTCAIYRVLFNWATPLMPNAPKSAKHFSASELELIRAAGVSFDPPQEKARRATEMVLVASEGGAPEEPDKIKEVSNSVTWGECPF